MSSGSIKFIDQERRASKVVPSMGGSKPYYDWRGKRDAGYHRPGEVLS